MSFTADDVLIVHLPSLILSSVALACTSRRSGGFMYNVSSFTLGLGSRPGLGSAGDSQPGPSSTQPQHDSYVGTGSRPRDIQHASAAGSDSQTSSSSTDEDVGLSPNLNRSMHQDAVGRRHTSPLTARHRKLAVREYVHGRSDGAPVFGASPTAGSMRAAQAAGASSPAAAGFNPNLTKKQVKTAAKKASKMERRAQRSGGTTGAGAAAGGAGIGAGSAAAQTAVPPSELNYAFAAFERYTTGIGSRLMQSMGWSEGQGLGRGRQGIAQPLMPVQRPKNLGLGM